MGIDKEWVERKARELQDTINSEIAAACVNQSPLRFETLAEQIAEEHLARSEWEWTWHQDISGRPPRLIITRFLK